MTLFDLAWDSLKKATGGQPGIENDPPLDDEHDPNDPDQRKITGWGPGDKNNPHGLPNFEDSYYGLQGDDPVNDAHEHFYASDNDFDERKNILAQEVSRHLRDVYNSYKDGHPEWDNPQPGQDGPPGESELSALIEEMANIHGAQLPW